MILLARLDRLAINQTLLEIQTTPVQTKSPSHYGNDVRWVGTRFAAESPQVVARRAMTATLHEAHFVRCGMKIGEWLALIGTVVTEFFARPRTAVVLNCRVIELLSITPISATPSRSALGVTNLFGPPAAKTFLHREWDERAVGREN
jgi:hypothetical protein